MEDTKTIDAKLMSAIQELQEVALKRIEEVKILQDKVTKLSIENVKLHDIVTNLRKNFEQNATKPKQEADLAIQDIEEKGDNNQLVSKETSESIDISISQLKGILNKSKK